METNWSKLKLRTLLNGCLMNKSAFFHYCSSFLSESQIPVILSVCPPTDHEGQQRLDLWWHRLSCTRVPEVNEEEEIIILYFCLPTRPSGAPFVRPVSHECDSASLSSARLVMDAALHYWLGASDWDEQRWCPANTRQLLNVFTEAPTVPPELPVWTFPIKQKINSYLREQFQMFYFHHKYGNMFLNMFKNYILSVSLL